MAELRSRGLLEREDVFLPQEDSYPLEIPLDIDGLLNMLDNPMVKPFRKKITENFRTNWKKMKGLACA